MISERFIYQKGDIEIKDTQCGFCKFNDEERPLYCINYPNGKPENVIKGTSRCEHLSY